MSILKKNIEKKLFLPYIFLLIVLCLLLYGSFSLLNSENKIAPELNFYAYYKVFSSSFAFLFLYIYLVNLYLYKIYLKKIILNIFILLIITIVFTLSYIIGFADVYTRFGINDGVKDIHDMSTSLYFSMVTFTTLGYGDLKPTISSRFFASGEAFMGYIFLGIFISFLINTISEKR